LRYCNFHHFAAHLWGAAPSLRTTDVHKCAVGPSGDLRVYQEGGSASAWWINLREAICASSKFTRLSIVVCSL